jgi:hypothetical protein
VSYELMRPSRCRIDIDMATVSGAPRRTLRAGMPQALGINNLLDWALTDWLSQVARAAATYSGLMGRITLADARGTVRGGYMVYSPCDTGEWYAMSRGASVVVLTPPGR